MSAIEFKCYICDEKIENGPKIVTKQCGHASCLKCIPAVNFEDPFSKIGLKDSDPIIKTINGLCGICFYQKMAQAAIQKGSFQFKDFMKK